MRERRKCEGFETEKSEGIISAVDFMCGSFKRKETIISKCTSVLS